MDDRNAYILLNMISGIGPARMAALSSFCGSPGAIFECDEMELSRISGIGPALAGKIVHWRQHVDLERELELAEKGGVRILTRDDPDYPASLLAIHDAPLCLYLRGTLPPELSTRSIAMVGTRNASHYGIAMARHMAESAAYAKWVTVSGLAVGIDTEVHRATLDAGGKTVAVLGGGLARLHPQENIPLARGIVETGGAVLSEFPINFTPTRHSFPMRNRIIAGLTLGTLVIEAGVNSGSLITAAQALEQNRHIFAVPGQADSRNANGCNALIRQGATLAETFDHILEEFDFLPGFSSSPSLCSEDSPLDPGLSGAAEFDEGLSTIDLKILDLLKKDDSTLDMLCNELPEFNAADLSAALISLEILRKVKRESSGFYKRLR